MPAKKRAPKKDETVNVEVKPDAKKAQAQLRQSVAPRDDQTSSPGAQNNENYDEEITLSHNVDGLWFWHKGDQKSEVGFNHPSMARLAAPSSAKPSDTEE